jgi:2-polyprenyl-6-methoxyphenol hydroxylase-like FAD-dependent oxidoreductase
MRSIETQVLVAGGGPVGLATAVELGLRGIQCTIVEPRRTISTSRPRCKTINVRTMEHLRRWGLSEQLRARAPIPVGWSQDVVFCTSLCGHELSRFHGAFGLSAEGDRFPEVGQQAPQYVLEAMLRSAAEALPSCRLRLGERVVGAEPDADEVRVLIVGEAQEPTVITAQYLVGADGPRSVVRPGMGAAYQGDLAARPNYGMVFRAPSLLAKALHPPAIQYWVVNSTAPALMGPLDLNGTWWMIAFGVDQETGQREAQQLIAGAAGCAIQAEVLSHDPWRARMQLADRLRNGRTFLAGDAAHLNPPFGGHGLNTGVGDAVDLGWKLAAVLDGWGGPALLDSYEAERRPVQRRIIEAAVANMSVLSLDLLAEHLDTQGPVGDEARRRAHHRIQATKRDEFHSLSLVLDDRIDSSPVMAEGPGVASSAVGARLPHAWLGHGLSLYDELGAHFTLLVLDRELIEAAGSFERACRERGVPLKALDVSQRLPQHRYGAGLLLVRPDQYVCWSSDALPEEPATIIDLVRGAVDSRRELSAWVPRMRG